MCARSLCLAIVSIAASAADAQNLVVNGGFEAGLTGVSSDYLHTPQGNTDEGTWWVTPHDPGGAWGPGRSPDNQGRMNANGDDSSLAQTNRVWFQAVNVVAGQAYEFSAWAWATVGGTDGYQLRFAFDDVQIGDTMLATQAQQWESFDAVYVAPVNGAVDISIVNVSGQTFPNDFMLDDISLRLVPEPDSAVIAAALLVATALKYTIGRRDQSAATR